jgi:hypothetical protein
MEHGICAICDGFCCICYSRVSNWSTYLRRYYSLVLRSTAVPQKDVEKWSVNYKITSAGSFTSMPKGTFFVDLSVGREA